MYSLIQFLKKVKDFRREQGKRHLFWLIILIVILGLMTQHLGYRALGNFAKFHQERLTNNLSIVRGKVPSYSTIRRAMMGIDCADLIGSFNQWVSHLVRDYELDNWLAISAIGSIFIFNLVAFVPFLAIYF